MRALSLALLLGGLPLLALSCRFSSRGDVGPSESARTAAAERPSDLGFPRNAVRSTERPELPAVPAPLHLDGKAFDAAGALPLPEVLPEAPSGLRNVYRLSSNIVSGSEPADENALVHLRDIGVRTILSVDGKQPEAAAAAALGMRYVHVPIQYSDISDEELAQIAKTFRELEGPFYVHCFHGKHRGPAAAAVGRVVLDGASRESAIAEMRQYCGTSSKYEGLYRVVATRELPTPEATREFDYDFAARRQPGGLVEVMVHLSRGRDNVELLRDRSWAADPAHPDVDALNEAQKLRDAYASACELDEVRNGPEDQRRWFEASLAESEALVEVLERFRDGEDTQTTADLAAGHFASIRRLCSECHAGYRN